MIQLKLGEKCRKYMIDWLNLNFWPNFSEPLLNYVTVELLQIYNVVFLLVSYDKYISFYPAGLYFCFHCACEHHWCWNENDFQT